MSIGPAQVLLMPVLVPPLALSGGFQSSTCRVAGRAATWPLWQA